MDARARPSGDSRAAETNLNAAERLAQAKERKAELERQKKLRNQKEIVIEVGLLTGKGYPAAVNLDSGAGTVTTVAQR